MTPGAVAGFAVRRIAVVDPVGNLGGGTRFLRKLLPEFRRVRANLDVRFFGHPASLAREDLGRELVAAGVKVETLRWTANVSPSSRSVVARLRFKARRIAGLESRDASLAARNRAARELELLSEDADVMWFAWPYWIDPPRLKRPAIATIHDLNFKYFFGAQIFSVADASLLERQIAAWTERASIVTSSQFMADEVRRFYPSSREPRVIRLAPFVSANLDAEASRRATEFGRYVLCGTHLTVHKNLGPLLAAHAIVRQRFPEVRLLLTGAGTEAATGQATGIGTIVQAAPADVVGLGYVSHDQIDALISGAAVVVNPSLYEAGNGSGVDAWSLGRPVAMSDIAAFREHVEVQGVRAKLFDPRDPGDIAAKIIEILANPVAASEAAAMSRNAMSHRTWADVAADYLSAFDAAAGSANA